MSAPRYAIGIDLGTTNCALAYAPLTGSDAVRIFPLEQWVEVGQVDQRNTLPSFLYYPIEAEQKGFHGGPGMVNEWVVGLAARAQSVRTPGRVVLSAKSWLASHAGNLESVRLPWKSDALATDVLLSPLEASAAYLLHMRRVWDSAHPEAPLAEQSITLTVPASFDAAAQSVTREAAARAGFPPSMRLLEEPQAAFYRWLERNEFGGGKSAEGRQVLVVDVGGGTSDFSLFRVGERPEKGGAPQIERVAVSEHILLGGDNIDLALAHFLEAQLLPDGSQIEGDSWNHLVARARGLKERALAGDGEARLPVAIPGRGSGLLAGTLSTEVSAAEIREIVLEGFFSPCERTARPLPGQSGLQEWGLPYAADFAVTRYLADFVRDHPPVDAVLFNGGSLAAPVLRERLCEQLGAWQKGNAPQVLENAETDLAVACGAATYGRVLAGQGQRIAAGAARAVFLELSSDGERPQLLCVLPRGAVPEAVHRVEVEGLRVRLNEPVQFRAFQGVHGREEASGEVVSWELDDFHELPRLATVLALPGRDASEAIPVVLESSLNELGLLQVELVSRPPLDPRRWPLAFNLRAAAETPATPSPTVQAKRPTPVEALDAERVTVALEHLQQAFEKKRIQKGERLTAARVLKRLEEALALPRMEWPLDLVRRMGDQLLAEPEARHHSPEHLEAWLYLVGWCLRPGFGDGRDAGRIDKLWEILRPEAFLFAKRTEAPYSLLWRRLVGGLSTERQTAFFEARIELWRDPRRASPEGIRLAGALERLDRVRKEELVSIFLHRAVALAGEEGHPAPYLAALGGLLTRLPLRTEGAAVLAPSVVERAWTELAPLDWASPALAHIGPLFLQAARRVDVPEIDLPARTVRKIVDRLAKAGVPSRRLQVLREFFPLVVADRATRYEETLPPGLVFTRSG